MGLDIRIPIGAMFALLGALLTVYGLISDPGIYTRSLGMNVNLWWGIILLVFGIIMLVLAKLAAGKGKSAQA
jgi:multisubunit Na+/H+ antiporter MnhG subunit